MESVFELQHWLHTEATGALIRLHSTGLAGMPALVGAAFGLGLLHALLPGHGKSILASCYTGDGRFVGAIASSAVLIAMHVGSAVAIVLSGLAILERTVANAGRAPALEHASSIFIVAIGRWLLWRAARAHTHDHGRSGAALAFVTGLVPCPLTAFIMTYAAAHGIIAAGLLLSATFAAGMIATVATFPLLAVLFRTRLMPLMADTEGARRRAGRALEMGGATAVALLGLWPLLARQQQSFM